MMDSKQVLQEKEIEIQMKAVGLSFEDVVAKLFKGMRDEVFKQIVDPIIQIEAQQVYFDEVQSKKKIEKFLFVFMPREKTDYYVKARIVVKVKYIQYDKEGVQ